MSEKHEIVGGTGAWDSSSGECTPEDVMSYATYDYDKDTKKMVAEIIMPDSSKVDHRGIELKDGGNYVFEPIWKYYAGKKIKITVEEA